MVCRPAPVYAGRGCLDSDRCLATDFTLFDCPAQAAGRCQKRIILPWQIKVFSKTEVHDGPTVLKALQIDTVYYELCEAWQAKERHIKRHLDETDNPFLRSTHKGCALVAYQAAGACHIYFKLIPVRV